jgi:predicted naringenin-chalcone synthase
MPVSIHHLETMAAGRAYPQSYASEKMQEWAADATRQRLIRALYRHSGIEQRHSVIESFDEGGPDDFFPLDGEGRRRNPTTAKRNALYAQAAKPLAVELARRTIDHCPGIEPVDITHVVTVSCTGFYNPGPDYQIIVDLGLSPSTQRYHIGFMGCYGAFPGLRMAQQFCLAHPDAVVLVVCLELCSLHLKLEGEGDSLLANSLFADGAAAALVSARPLSSGQLGYRLGTFRSALIPSGQKEMAWTIGDIGFDISLSSYVPKIIGANIEEAVAPLLQSAALDRSDISTWAVHPGGKAIVDKVATSLALAPRQVEPSRQVLRRFGNMSSATILFVLQEILRRDDVAAGENVCAMAFGPGLTVEMALLETLRG